MSALSVFTQVILPTGVVIGVVVVGVHGINKHRRRDIDRVNESIDALGEVVAVAITPVQVQQKRRQTSSGEPRDDVVVPFPRPTDPLPPRLLSAVPQQPPPRGRASRLAGLAWKVAPRLLTGSFAASIAVLLAVAYGAPQSHGEDLHVLPPTWAPLEPNPVAGHARPTATSAPGQPPPATPSPTQAPEQAPALVTQAPALVTQAPASSTRAPMIPIQASVPTTSTPTPTTTPPTPATTPPTVATTPPTSLPSPEPVAADGKPVHGNPRGDYLVKREACVADLHVLILNVSLLCQE